MAVKKKIRIIANPFSGSKGGEKIQAVINDYLDKSIFNHEVCMTQYPGHAAILSSEAAAAEYYAVVAAGGDGTINEVASGLVDTKTALGIIPMGSGNGFSYHLGIRRNKKKAIEAINGCKTVCIDTGLANGHFFINVAGMGLDAAVAYHTRQNKRRGFLPYFFNAIRETLRFQYMHLSITADGREMEGDYATVVVANASIYGYDFSIAPEADFTDGKFDVILLKKSSVLNYFMAVPRMITRSIHKSSLVEFFRASEISVRHSGTSYFHKDGEGTVMQGDIIFRLKPASLNVLMP